MKPINETALHLAIAFAQAEYFQELRTGTMPVPEPENSAPTEWVRMERFAEIVSAAYEHYANTCGIQNTLNIEDD